MWRGGADAVQRPALELQKVRKSSELSLPYGRAVGLGAKKRVFFGYELGGNFCP